MNDQCVEDKPTQDDVLVVIQLDDSVKVEDLNISEIYETIRVQCGIDSDDFTLGWHSEKDGLVVIVYVNDDPIANKIADTINQLEEGEDCQFGILCMAKDVQIVRRTLSGTNDLIFSFTNVLAFLLISHLLFRAGMHDIL